MSVFEERHDEGPGAVAPRAPRIKILSGLGERCQGLKDESLLSCAYVVLVPCRDIHTFGMRVPLDVAFVNEWGMVIEVHRRVLPSRRLRCPAARMTIERQAATGAWFQTGDVVFDDRFGVNGEPAAGR